MKIKRRTKIISETERRLSFDIRRRTIRFFCAACDEQAEMLSINEAAAEGPSSWREIVFLIEDGSLHAVETDAGAVYVCRTSLAAFDFHDKNKDSEQENKK